MVDESTESGGPGEPGCARATLKHESIGSHTNNSEKDSPRELEAQVPRLIIIRKETSRGYEKISQSVKRTTPE